MLGTQTSLPLMHVPSLWRGRLQRVRGAFRRNLDPQEILVREGDALSALSVIEGGAVATGATDPSGRVATICILGPDDVVGLEALAGRRAESPPWATALIRSSVMTVPIEELSAVIPEDPVLAAVLVSKAAEQLRRMERSLAEALTAPVRDRVLNALRDLAFRHGRATYGGTKITIPLSQDLLATMVGATRESVNRALRDLRSAGAIRTGGRTYVVSDMNGHVVELGRS